MPTSADPAGRPPVTLRTLAEMASRREPFAALTCYDFTTARWLALGGVHVLLVGDTAAEVILGHPRTVHMPMDLSVWLTGAVKRGAPGCVVLGDMPFMSYHASEADAMRNAGRFLTEGLADVVKVEADRSLAPLVAKMVRAGIPMCGHVGSLPQRAALSGGYSSAGRTAAEASRIIDDAAALEDAGCSLLLVEAVPDEVTERILARTRTPLIGIGAGPACHGQVLVLQDLVGMGAWQPRFAEPVASLGQALAEAASEWVKRVGARSIGGRGYSMKPGESEKLSESGPGPADESQTVEVSTRAGRSLTSAAGSAGRPDLQPKPPETEG